MKAAAPGQRPNVERGACAGFGPCVRCSGAIDFSDCYGFGPSRSLPTSPTIATPAAIGVHLRGRDDRLRERIIACKLMARELHL